MRAPSLALLKALNHSHTAFTPHRDVTNTLFTVRGGVGLGLVVSWGGVGSVEEVERSVDGVEGNVEGV